MRLTITLHNRTSPPHAAGTINISVVAQQSSLDVSLNAARAGMVLLKNDGNILPFTAGKTVAVLGLLRRD